MIKLLNEPPIGLQFLCVKNSVTSSVVHATGTQPGEHEDRLRTLIDVPHGMASFIIAFAPAAFIRGTHATCVGSIHWSCGSVLLTYIVTLLETAIIVFTAIFKAIIINLLLHFGHKVHHVARR